MAAGLLGAVAVAVAVALMATAVDWDDAALSELSELSAPTKQPEPAGKATPSELSELSPNLAGLGVWQLDIETAPSELSELSAPTTTTTAASDYLIMPPAMRDASLRMNGMFPALAESTVFCGGGDVAACAALASTGESYEVSNLEWARALSLETNMASDNTAVLEAYYGLEAAYAAHVAAIGTNSKLGACTIDVACILNAVEDYYRVYDTWVSTVSALVDGGVSTHAASARTAFEDSLAAVDFCAPLYGLGCVMLEGTGPMLAEMYHDRLWREAVEYELFGSRAGTNEWKAAHEELMVGWDVYYADVTYAEYDTVAAQLDKAQEYSHYNKQSYSMVKEWHDGEDVASTLKPSAPADFANLHDLATAYATGLITEFEFSDAVRRMASAGDIPTIVQPPTAVQGIITRVIDGNTVLIDDMRIRLPLLDVEDSGNSSMPHAALARALCPTGSAASYDIDDGQPEDRYGRTIGMVWCNADGGHAISLDRALVSSGLGWVNHYYCDRSEFGGLWPECSSNS